MLILTIGGGEDIRIIKLLFQLFEGLSGLSMNYQKTCMFSSRIRQKSHTSLAEMVYCASGTLPLTYLGIPISGKRPQKQDWDILIHNIRSCLVSWKARLLSLEGKLTLLNSVLSAICTYSTSIFKLPRWVIKEINRVRRDFLWSGPDLDHPELGW